MAKTYTLRRIIPANECPGTCCKVTGVFPPPGLNGQCQHFDDNAAPGRGCPFFKANGSVDQGRLNSSLTVIEQTRFHRGCSNWPVPGNIPAFDTPYPTNFGRLFEDACDCFEWEIS